MNTRKRARKGFTTVELVIVIAVIAILAVVLVPTFSGLIEKANLSADKQNVRNMNVVLATYITDGEPENFGALRMRLIDGGYKTGEEFKPKTKGHSFIWYSVDNVILLVDNDNKVVFPEEYKGFETWQLDADYKRLPDGQTGTSGAEVLRNIRISFDLSLPAMLVEKDNAPESVQDNEGNLLDLSVKYTFTADGNKDSKYKNWFADFYVYVDLPEELDENAYLDKTNGEPGEPVNPVLITIAGSYGEYGWDSIPILNVDDSTEPFPDGIPLLQTMRQQVITYSDVLNIVQVFDCGVVGDAVDAADNIVDKGVKLTVELRITETIQNPNYEEDGNRYVKKDGGEEKVLGIFHYTFQ